MTVPARRLRVVAALVSAFSLVLVALTAVTGPPAVAARGDFTARGSARQVYAVGLPHGARATLLDARGHVVKRQHADSLGGVLFRARQAGQGLPGPGGGTAPRAR